MIDFVKKVNLTRLLIAVVLSIFIAFCFTSYAVFIGTFVLTSAALLAVILAKSKYSESDTEQAVIDIKAVKRVVVYLIVVCVSIALVIFRNFDDVVGSMLFGGIFCLAASTCILIAAIIIAVRLKALTFKISREMLSEYLPIIIVMGLVFVLSIDSFYTYASHDTREYYTALQQVNIFSFNKLDALRLCLHPCIVYTIMVYLVYCLIGNLYAAAILFNILCVMLSTLVMYKLIKKVCPKNEKLFAYLGAVLFAFSPSTFGLTGYIFIDVTAMYAALFFLYCFLTKDEYLIFLSAGFLIFTKEQGIFASAALIFGAIAFRLFRAAQDNRFWDEAEKQFNPFNIYLLVLHLVFVAIFFLGNWAGGGGLPIGLNAPSISNMFLTNFNWVFAAFIVAAAVKFVFEHAQGKIKLKDSYMANKAMIPIAVVFVVMMMFNLLIATWNHYRYLLIQVMALYIMGIFSISYLFKDFSIKKIKVAYVAVILLLPTMFIQNYFTIDPAMVSNKNRISTGTEGSYIFNVGYRDELWLALSDNCIYNKQSNQFAVALDKAIAAMNYDSSTCIITSLDASDGSYKGRGFGTVWEVYGDQLGMGWDPVTQRRFDTVNESEHLNYYQLWEGQGIDAFLAEGNYGRYYYLDYNSGLGIEGHPNKSIEYILNNFSGITVEETIEVSYFSWRFTISKISYKN